MKTAPRANDENARLEALKEYLILDTEQEQAFDDIAALASFICDTPISTITFIDSSRQWFKSKVGLNNSETSRDIAFCAHTILQDDILIVPDATSDDRFFDNPLVLGEPDIRFYAGMPLVTASGFKLGTICVIDSKPKKLSAKQKFALKVLRDHVMKLLELQKNNLEYIRIHDMNNKLLSIIGHDLRSPLNSIAGILNLAEKHNLTIHEYKEILPRMRSLVDSSSDLLSNLLQWGKSQIEGATSKKERINLYSLAQDIIETNAELFRKKGNNVLNNLSRDHEASIHKGMIQFVFRNLILNSNKFMANGNIVLNSCRISEEYQVSVSDSGIGLDKDKDKSIFSWHDRVTADGTDGEKGSGLGLPMSKEFLQIHNGTIWFESESNKGTTFYFTLPISV